MGSEVELTPDQLMAEMHWSRVGYFGIKETWERLNKHHPGHGISYQEVQEFINFCPTCQKTRKERKNRLIRID